MADPSPESDRGGRYRVAQNKISDKIEIHRVNEVLLGHVGQVSYHSVRDEDADIGELGFNRVVENPPSFQQLLPSEQCFAPTRARPDLSHGSTFQDTKSQKYWLLKTHPEAYLGNVNLKETISEQLRASRSGDDGVGGQLGSVLAVGEISDLRSTSHPKPCPAVAMAAGEGGHVLRVSMIALERWSWSGSSLPIGATQSQFHGTWSSDGSSISKIQFATKPRQHDPIRWLVAQKSTSTTIFQPEIRAKPTTSVAHRAILDDAELQHIRLDPIVTLTKDVTGGNAHSDFSINVGSETEAPQIAIVDMSGNWSVWFLDSQGHQYGGGGVYTAVPKSRGSFELPLLSRPSDQLRHAGNHFRVSWVCKSAKDDDWERESTPSEAAGSRSRPLQTDYLTGHVDSSQKYDGLLICDSSGILILDTEVFKTYSHLDFSRRPTAGTLLEAQSIEGCPNNVLVLTTEQLYVLNISSIEDEEPRKPNVLVSSPHFRGKDKQALKMSVARLRSSAESTVSLVLVYSNQNSRVQLFCLTISSRDGSASFHHQVVHFPGLRTSLGELAGFASIYAVPLRRSLSMGRRRAGSQAIGAYMDSHDTQTFQLFGLGIDMSLSSSVVAITTRASQWLRRPETSAKAKRDDTKWRTSLRKRVLREAADALIVPDAVEEVKQLGRQRVAQNLSAQESIQLRKWMIELMNEINAGFFGACSLGSDDDNSAGPFGSIEDLSEKRELYESVALQPLLRFKDPWHALDIANLEALWNRDLERLKKSSDIQLTHCSAFGPTLDVTDFFERFSINWSSRLAAESLTATQWRYMQLALERMAADVYLSGKGVYMVPQTTLDLVSRTKPRLESSQSTVDELYEETPFSRAGSEMTLPTPSATPSSSRATSQVADSVGTQDTDDESGSEDPAVTRMRMYLPSVKFIPRPKQGQSRIVSLWPEQRGSDPANYKYSRHGKGADGLSERARRRREKEEERRRRKAERKAQLGIKLEDFGDSFSQASIPDEIRSSPPPQLFAKSQGHSHGFGFGSQSQAQSQSQSFGPFQTMSQPLRGEFGTRTSLLKKNSKGKPRAISGFK
ncbi:hypothetical protein KVR01_009869 [Diaporthe batatas]|uniref:uncharacterized protein n=1 Tax=Diaporthe batatas TaxID=748121 RepID=UPI001D049962|nr:uncharacterized protein KVR01_009869 [Diaporthe batatas]KAG8160333.1 hypothetical protein KVR01_009869 [Diaporthe batatas]